MFGYTFNYILICLVRWVVSSCKPYLSHTLLMISCKNMLESFSFRPSALDLLHVKCSYVMADCSFSLALCTENKCFSTIYYILVGYENLGIPLSDTGKSMVKKKPEGHPLWNWKINVLVLISKNWKMTKTSENTISLEKCMHFTCFPKLSIWRGACLFFGC